MILRGIVGTFKTIVTVIVKVVTWLLIAIGLWLPAIYSVVFFIVCAVTKTSFSSIKTLFFLGLILTTVLSVWYTLSSGKNKKNDKKKSGATQAFVSKIREKEHRVELASAPPNGSVFRQNEEDAESQAQSAKRDYNSLKSEYYKDNKPNREVEQTASNNYDQQRQNSSAQFQPYHPYPNQAQNQAYGNQQYQGNADFQPYNNQNQVQNDINRYDGQSNGNQVQPQFQSYHAPNDNFYGQNRDSHAQEHERRQARTRNETPRIFLSRKDNTILIYEYSDRLDYYRKTRSGIIYDGTRYKH